MEKQKEFSPFKVPHRVRVVSVDTFKGVKLCIYAIITNLQVLEIDDKVSIIRNEEVIGSGKVSSLSGINFDGAKPAYVATHENLKEIMYSRMWGMSSTSESNSNGRINVDFFQDFEVGDIIETIK